MDDHKNNPAGRLYLFLKGTQASNRSASIADVWSHYFGVSKDDIPQFFRVLEELVRLPDLAEAAIDRLDQRDVIKAEYKEALPGARRIMAFVRNTDGAINLANQHVNEAHLDKLKIASLFIGDVDTATDDSLAQLRSAVQDLILQIEQASGLDEQFRVYVLAILHRILELISTYKVGGAQPIREESEKLLARLIVNRRERSEVARRPKLQTALVTVIIAIDAITGVSHDLTDALQAVTGTEHALLQIESETHQLISPDREQGPANAASR